MHIAGGTGVTDAARRIGKTMSRRHPTEAVMRNHVTPEVRSSRGWHFAQGLKAAVLAVLLGLLAYALTKTDTSVTYEFGFTARSENLKSSGDALASTIVTHLPQRSLAAA